MNPLFIQNMLAQHQGKIVVPLTLKKGRQLHRFTMEELAIIHASFDLKFDKQGMSIKLVERWIKNKFPKLHNRYVEVIGREPLHRLYYHKWYSSSRLHHEHKDFGKLMKKGKQLVLQADAD